ncbi:MAG: hypothetical protein RLN81_13525 [Balneolaceae bacterium]
MSQKNSFPCPECNAAVEIAIEDLLHGKSIACPSCSVSFKIGTDESKNALDAIQKLRNKLDL